MLSLREEVKYLSEVTCNVSGRFPHRFDTFDSFFIFNYNLVAIERNIAPSKRSLLVIISLAVAVLCRLQLSICTNNNIRTCHIGILAVEQDRNLLQSLVHD